MSAMNLKAEELTRLVALGLGRGVDATDASPWVSKSSFQLRQVHNDNVIVTEESGALQRYESEITCSSELQASLKSSIVIPRSPVTLGVDAELSRSTTFSRRAVGVKVLNRTLSFRDDFDDQLLGGLNDFESAQKVVASEIDLASSESQPESKKNMPIDFENSLAKWLVRRIVSYRVQADTGLFSKHSSLYMENTEAVFSVTATFQEDTMHNPLEALGGIIKRGNPKELQLIVEACGEFVQHFHITHYVSAVELGAAEYSALTRREYETMGGLSGSVGVENIANGSFRNSFSFKKSSKLSEMKKIGKINHDNETVQRESTEEAVIGVKVHPITNLVRLAFLRLALQKALVQYIENKQSNDIGKGTTACQ